MLEHLFRSHMKEQGSLHFLIQAFESSEDMSHQEEDRDRDLPEWHRNRVDDGLSASSSAPLRRRSQPTAHTTTCQNRECDKPSGYTKKPNSIYCSSRCQSREQNLRQGRVKNVKRTSPTSPIQKVTLTRLRAKSSSPPSFSLPSTPSMLPLRRTPLVTHEERPHIIKPEPRSPQSDSSAKLRIDFLLS